MVVAIHHTIDLKFIDSKRHFNLMSFGIYNTYSCFVEAKVNHLNNAK